MYDTYKHKRKLIHKDRHSNEPKPEYAILTALAVYIACSGDDIYIYIYPVKMVLVDDVWIWPSFCSE